MRLDRCDDLVLWWIGPDVHRAIVLSAAYAREAFDTAVGLLPGAASSPQSIHASLSCLVDPGQPLAIHSHAVDDRIGLVQPFAAGRAAGADLTFTAVVEHGTLRLPLLSADPAEIRRATQALDERAHRSLAWQAFTIYRSRYEFEAELKTLRSGKRGPATPRPRLAGR